MSKKIVLKVSITSEQCKNSVMKTAAKLCGINSLALDAEKGILTVVGEVDVVCVVTVLRKAMGDKVHVVSVGPEKPPEPPKKPDEPKKPELLNPCCVCNACRPMPYGNVVVYEEQPYGCIIL